MRHSFLLFFFVLGAVAACSSSSSDATTYDCNGGFPSAGDACPTEGQTCEDEGPPCGDGRVISPNSDGAIIYTCSGGRLVVTFTPQCASEFDGSTGDSSPANDATVDADAASIDAADDAND